MRKMTKMMVWAVPVALLYTLFAGSIGSTPWIWYLTRVFGLASFFFLFITIMLGELRLLSFAKSKFKLFKYHIPISVFTLVLVFLHFVSAAADRYQWGKGLALWQYLGFSFSDKWLVFLSLGTLGFYLLLLVGITSMSKPMRALGYKNWKLVHLFSYIAFIFAYIHTVNLGTDVKTSILAPILKPMVLVMFWLVIAFLIVRILRSFDIFVDQAEITLTAAFSVLLIVGGVFVSMIFISAVLDVPFEQTGQIVETSAQIEYYEQANNLLFEQNRMLQEEIAHLRGDADADMG